MAHLRDLTGQRSGKVVPLRYAGNSKWLCECDCGVVKELGVSGLRQGKTQSCGCERTQKTIDRNRLRQPVAPREDLTGKTFERLTVLDADGPQHWKCRCVCGVEKVIQHHNLTRGVTRSCGCLLRDKNSAFRVYENTELRDKVYNDKKRKRRHTDPVYAERIRAICRASGQRTYHTPRGKARAAQKDAQRRACCRIGEISDVQWLRLVEAWENQCAYCHEERKLTQDHVVPIVRGGKHTIENVVPACRGCNAKKSDLELEDALRRLGCSDFHERRAAAMLLLKDMSNA